MERWFGDALQFNKKSIDMVSAFCPYFALVSSDNGFSNREAKTKTAGSASGLICAIKSLEKIIQIFGRYFVSFIRYGQ